MFVYLESQYYDPECSCLRDDHPKDPRSSHALKVRLKGILRKLTLHLRNWASSEIVEKCCELNN
jgi:hypothetical protein